MKHLFIEGPIQTGKSTLLRKCLYPYKSQLGGFSSQRLMNENELAAGYRITEATDFCLQQKPNFSLPGIFQKKAEEGSKKNPEVFENYGVMLLEKSNAYPLILLDEIGGAELLYPNFYRKLYEILEGDIPCIGVIKLNEKARFMSQEAKYPSDIVSLNLKLRYDIINKFDGKVISFNDNSEKEIKEFLCGIFMTD